MDSSTKYQIVERIIQTRNETLLQEIKNLLDLSEDDFWNNLSSSTKASIERGVQDAEDHNPRSHDEVISDLRSRFLK